MPVPLAPYPTPPAPYAPTPPPPPPSAANGMLVSCALVLASKVKTILDFLCVSILKEKEDEEIKGMAKSPWNLASTF
jgi:CRISPR/Cas system-associated protein Cas5 (RAMP superfamily)